MPTPEVAVLVRTALLSSLLFLTACGQKGPLYLPQDPVTTPEEVTAAQTPAEAATEKDKPEADASADSLD